MTARNGERRRRPVAEAALALIAAIVAGCGGGGQDADVKNSAAESRPAEDFSAVRTFFAAKCFKCHGPDEAARQAGLRLDERAGQIATLPSGRTAVVPGAPAASELMARLRATDPLRRMPPPGAGEPASPTELTLLGRWIAAGAPASVHRPYSPLVRPTPPAGATARDPLDRFFDAATAAAGVAPAPEAPSETLIRRASLDLIGLPPTPEDLDRFYADGAPGAYERLVDRLLASPRFGEHWARWWSDLARYADTKGYEKDGRRQVWPWRDWVIRAFDADLPLDRFALLQLAGDLLPDATDDDRLATAFHRHTMTNDEGGTDDEEFRVAAVFDRVETTAEIFLGLTANCARCHTHKYDPLLQTDYYRLFALFNTTADADRDDEAPTLAVRPTPFPADGAEATTRPAPAAPVRVPVLAEAPPEGRRVTRLLRRGSFLDPGDPVAPGVPAFLASTADGPVADRLAFARWLFAPRQPLTPRVLANRLFERLFGYGLVATLEDFGVQGAPAVHPEALDELAASLRDGGYRLKPFLRRLALTDAYRRGRAPAVATARTATPPPFARALRPRLDAEVLRDQALAAAGLLSARRGGPSVFPPQPDGVWSVIYSDDAWRPSSGEDRYRRGLYTFFRRTAPYPSFQLFDAPSRDVCSSRRLRTDTPLQAYVMLNDPAFVEAARALARRVLREARAPEGRVLRAFRLLLARSPSAAETARFVAFAAAEESAYRADPARAAAAEGGPELPPPFPPRPPGVDDAELAAWSAVMTALLNLDETLCRP